MTILKHSHASEKKEEAYQGEWYVPDPEGEAFDDYRMREKGYAMIAAFLHIVVGFVPAMGLNYIAAACFYAAQLFLVLYMTWISWRGPASHRPYTIAEYRRYGRMPRILTNLSRIMVILTLVFDVIGNFRLGLDITVWLMLQLILLLLEALSLQFLYRHQRGLTFTAVAK